MYDLATSGHLVHSVGNKGRRFNVSDLEKERKTSDWFNRKNRR